MSQPQAYYIPTEGLGGEARDSLRRDFAYTTGVKAGDPRALLPLPFDPTIHETAMRQPTQRGWIVAWGRPRRVRAPLAGGGGGNRRRP